MDGNWYRSIKISQCVDSFTDKQFSLLPKEKNFITKYWFKTSGIFELIVPLLLLVFANQSLRWQPLFHCQPYDLLPPRWVAFSVFRTAPKVGWVEILYHSSNLHLYAPLKGHNVWRLFNKLTTFFIIQKHNLIRIYYFKIVCIF